MKNSKRAMKKRQWCICNPPTRFNSETVVKGMCRYEHCVEFRCPRCKANLGGWGIMGCKCEGYVRWLWYPAMAPEFNKVARKPSLPQHRRHKGRVA